ncbi:MAG: SecY-interacting protein Syd [Pseudomonadota bacterium]
MTSGAERALDAFFDRARAWLSQPGDALPTVTHDPEWPSPAEVGAPAADGLVAWKAVRQSPPSSFADLENALELELHADASAFFTRYYAAHVEASYRGGNLTLLFVWNAEDFRLATGNLIGHALEKRRVRQPFTVFFANIDDSRFLSLDNDSGRVMLEVLGARDAMEVAPDLAAFLDELEAPVPS